MHPHQGIQSLEGIDMSPERSGERQDEIRTVMETGGTVQGLREVIDQLRVTNSNLKLKLYFMEKMTAELSEKLAETEDGQMSAKIEAMLQENIELKVSMTELRHSLSNNKDEASNQLQDLRREVEEMRAQETQQRSLSEEVDVETSLMRSQMVEMLQEFEERHQELQAKDQELRAVQAAHDDLIKAEITHKQEALDAQRVRGGLQDKVRNLEKRLKAFMDELEEAAKTEQSDSEAHRIARRQHRAEMEEARGEVEAAQHEAKMAFSQLDALRRRLEEQEEAEEERAREARAQLDEVQQRLKEQSQIGRGQAEGVEAQLLQLREKVAREAQQKEKLEAVVAELRRSKAQLISGSADGGADWQSAASSPELQRLRAELEAARESEARTRVVLTAHHVATALQLRIDSDAAALRGRQISAAFGANPDDEDGDDAQSVLNRSSDVIVKFSKRCKSLERQVHTAKAALEEERARRAALEQSILPAPCTRADALLKLHETQVAAEAQEALETQWTAEPRETQETQTAPESQEAQETQTTAELGEAKETQDTQTTAKSQEAQETQTTAELCGRRNRAQTAARSQEAQRRKPEAELQEAQETQTTPELRETQATQTAAGSQEAHEMQTVAELQETQETQTVAELREMQETHTTADAHEMAETQTAGEPVASTDFTLMSSASGRPTRPAEDGMAAAVEDSPDRHVAAAPTEAGVMTSDPNEGDSKLQAAHLEIRRLSAQVEEEQKARAALIQQLEAPRNVATPEVTSAVNNMATTDGAVSVAAVKMPVAMGEVDRALLIQTRLILEQVKQTMRNMKGYSIK
ncbi:hypothetical protein CYMTET_13767 [Cymbomonas tetramitiformis]|uniref:Centrosomin N-terminal motif 1 domain-containing protein n=1 Tax=Cymbomonas tetramitiformis TaxID=36881 RepID=A0AAE0GHF5_9CHLO|nr:hypothetical protein CYMTET_13767 [Cymbomonas tetramitiformis]